jgi:3-hydroxyisobutyrate dehydrogenase-like beta-hydroxyacid dehydrogenase
MGEQPGVATVVKQLGNFLIISMGRSLSEGLAIAESAGVDPMAGVNMLGESLFAIPIFRNYGRTVAEKKPVLASPIPAKDLGLFHQLADKRGLPNPITQTLMQLNPSIAK